MKSRGVAPLFLSRESWEHLRQAILKLEERGTRVNLTFALEDPEMGLRYVDMEYLLAQSLLQEGIGLPESRWRKLSVNQEPCGVLPVLLLFGGMLLQEAHEVREGAQLEPDLEPQNGPLLQTFYRLTSKALLPYHVLTSPL